MTSRANHMLLVAAAFLTGLGVFLGALWYVTGNFGASSVSTASAVGGPFKLVDQNNKPITDQDFKGKPWLVFFGYTHCPDVCPTTLFEVSEMFRAMGKDADRTGALFITVDPERDTPAVMKDYLSSFDPRLMAATGDRAAIDAAEKAYRVYAKKVPTGKGDDYSMDHTAMVYLMDKQGRFVAPFNLKRTPEEAAADLKKYL
ncbi:MAG: SCO family protein [Pseudolabrys sp.]|nr:SCO family protein [Pseudolabrys sp.]